MQVIWNPCWIDVVYWIFQNTQHQKDGFLKAKNSFFWLFFLAYTSKLQQYKGMAGPIVWRTKRPPIIARASAGVQKRGKN